MFGHISKSSLDTARSILTLLLFAALVAFVARSLPENPYASHTARAAAITLTGFAWSDTIGWVCFYDATSCPAAGVTIDAGNNLVGYAWSDSIGWIYFGTNSCGAAPAMNNGALSGFAQAVANSSGWDGCIKLSSATAPVYGVTLSGTDLAGFAWDSDTVGWLSFNCADAEPTSNTVVLTSSAGSSWVVPDGVTSLSAVECIGGGASGGATALYSGAATGGAGGAWAKATNISVTPGSSIAYQIGAGGKSVGALAGSYTGGNNGGDTWFGGTSFATSYCGAKGGSGGGAYYLTPVNGSGGGTATANRGGANGGGITNPGSTYSHWGGWSGYGNAAGTATGGGGAGGPNGDGIQGTNGVANSGTAGGSGDGGSGGAGSAGTASSDSAAGGIGTEYQTSPAYGSGGASGGARSSSIVSSGAGGYGAGSGGAIGAAGLGASSGKGGDGLIVVTYTAPSNICSRSNYKVSYNGPVTAPTCSLSAITPEPAGTGWTITIPYTTAGGAASSGTIRDSSNTVITTTATQSSGNVSATAPTTPGTYTYTLTVSNPIGSNACTSPALTVQLDKCTDITGIQQTLPTGCTGPTPSPIGSCLPSGYIYNGSICRPQYDYITSFTFVGPSRVRKGNTATLTYTVYNPSSTCTITGTNGYNSGSFTPTDGVAGQITTNAINARTEFSLSCGAQQAKTVVNVTPTFQEQ